MSRLRNVFQRHDRQKAQILKVSKESTTNHRRHQRVEIKNEHFRYSICVTSRFLSYVVELLSKERSSETRSTMQRKFDHDASKFSINEQVEWIVDQTIFESNVERQTTMFANRFERVFEWTYESTRLREKKNCDNCRARRVFVSMISRFATKKKKKKNVNEMLKIDWHAIANAHENFIVYRRFQSCF